MKNRKYRVKSPDKGILKVFQSILNKNNRRKNVYTSIFPVQVSINDGITKDKNIEDNKTMQKSIWIIEWHAFSFFVYLGCIIILARKSFFIGYKLWLLFINNSIYHSPIKQYALIPIRNTASFTLNVIKETMSIYKQNKAFSGIEIECRTQS